MNQHEALTLITFIVSALHFVYSPGALKSLLMAFNQIVINQGTISKDQFDILNTIAHKMTRTFPHMTRKRGAYYRALYDPEVTPEAHHKAKKSWHRKTNQHACEVIEREWYPLNGMLTKLQDAKVDVGYIAPLERYLKEQFPSQFKTDVVEYGNLRVISSRAS